jgi:hypothetical protein
LLAFAAAVRTGDALLELDERNQTVRRQLLPA